MPPKKERYNAKARQSVAGGHSHKHSKAKAKAKAQPDSSADLAAPAFDPNAAILDEEARERDRQRRQLLADAGTDEHAALSSKKKKRLDKYIASRLKKEERVGLLAKLAESSQDVANRTELKSAATLGTGKVRSVGERVEKLIGREHKVAAGARGKRKRAAAFEIEEDDEDADLDQQDGEDDAPRRPAAVQSAFSDADDAMVSDEPQLLPDDSAMVIPAAPAPSLAPLPLPTSLGSALALGSDGKPLMVVRKKKAKKPKKGDTLAALTAREADPDAVPEGGENDQGDDEQQARRIVGTSRNAPAVQSSASRPLLEMAAAVTAAPDEVKRTEEGETLQPLGGLSTKVKDMMDGVARGPLGRQELRPDETSAFSKKVYEEFRTAFTPGSNSKPNTNSTDVHAAATTNAYRAAVRNVSVTRSESLTAARMRLPVVAEEDRIIKTILENPVVVICGETGSGKTTQVPQFLFEAGFGTRGSLNPGMVGVTQPRRVAALSTAARVREELGLSEREVSHQIRYDANVSAQTAVKFMTDGVLLREVAADFLLEKYSAILVDEAHERSVNTDVLIGLLSRIVRLRERRWLEGKAGAAARPLRLIIMSATLRVSDFTENTTLFPSPPPVLNIEARQHPVTVHFNRRTTHDYLGEAVKKVSKIHTRLPPGGILVFLTGQQEIVSVCKKLEARFGRGAIARRKERATGLHWVQKREEVEAAAEGEKVELAAQHGDVEAEDMELGARSAKEAAPLPDALGLDETADGDGEDGEVVDAEALDTDSEAGGDEEEEEEDALDAELGIGRGRVRGAAAAFETDVPLHVLPLYSLLPSDRQMRVFDPPPPDARLVVVATNVAETSLTIPGIRYVVDCGRAKERRFDLVSGVQSFEVGWVSKASASQRAGRAGRTGPGHAYRLYSSALFEEHFDAFSSPEIVRTPVEGLVLTMKAMHIDQVTHFPFPTPPDRRTIAEAERALVRLGALEEAETVAGDKARGGVVARVTELGTVMSYFPVSPRFGKMLVQGRQHGCLPYVVIVVAALTVGDPFIHELALANDDKDDEDEVQAVAGDEDDYDGRSGKRGQGKQRVPVHEDPSDPEGIALAALHSEKAREKEARKLRRKRYFQAQQRFTVLGNGMSDVFRLLSVVGAFEHERDRLAFCEDNFLRFKAMDEIHKLRTQLSSIVARSLPGLDAATIAALRSAKVAPPTETQLKVLRQLLCSAFIDHVAVRADLVDSAADLEALHAQASSSTHRLIGKVGPGGGALKGAKMKSTRDVPYRALGLVAGEAAYIHPSSILYHQRPPEWLVFSERYRSAPPAVRRKKTATADGEQQDEETLPPVQGRVWLKTCTTINAGWLSSLGRKLCTFSKPVGDEAAAEGSSGAGGSTTAALVEALRAAKAKAQAGGNDSPNAGVTREVVLVPSFGAGMGAAGLGWELPPVKARQRLVQGRWVTEL